VSSSRAELNCASSRSGGDLLAESVARLAFLERVGLGIAIGSARAPHAPREGSAAHQACAQLGSNLQGVVVWTSRRLACTGDKRGAARAPHQFQGSGIPWWSWAMMKRRFEGD